MALRVERRNGPVTSDSLSTKKNPLCHTCQQRKPGLFTTDPYGKPLCADCARDIGKPID